MSYLFLLGKRTRNADAGKHNRKRSAVVLAVVAFGCELHPAAAGIDAAVYRTAGHDANAFAVEKVRKANFSAEMSGHCVHLEIRECNGVKIRFFFHFFKRNTAVFAAVCGIIARGLNAEICLLYTSDAADE